MFRHRLSKSKILSGLQCPKRLYLEVHHPELAEVSDTVEQRFSIGHRVGEVAREQYPKGILIDFPNDLNSALKETGRRLQKSGDTVLFEPAFGHGDVLVRADVLRRSRGGCHVVEVKSSTEVKNYHLIDAAIQWRTIAGAGYPLKLMSIAFVDNQFVYRGDGDYDGLFGEENVTRAIRPLIEQVPLWVADFQKMLSGAVPDIKTGKHCNDPFECPFIGHCSQRQPEFPVELLPRGGKLIESLRTDGYEDLRDVPGDRLKSWNHLRVWRVTRSGRAEIDLAVRDIVKGLPWPRFYLDFETIQFAAPIWAGTRPYEQLPFQWSCHIGQPDDCIEHREFLDTGGGAPMRAFAESLIAALGTSGAVITYSHFERTIIKSLIDRYPDLEADLSSIIERIVDLLPITREHYYHPAMKGSWSIKAVSPTIAPELDYNELADVRDGGGAQQAYLEIIDSDTATERRMRLTGALKDYCKRDTLAMVRLTEYFAGMKRAPARRSRLPS